MRIYLYPGAALTRARKSLVYAPGPGWPDLILPSASFTRREVPRTGPHRFKVLCLEYAPGPGATETVLESCFPPNLEKTSGRKDLRISRRRPLHYG